MAAGAGLLLLLAGIAGLVIMYSGVYSVAANTDHTRPVFWALEQGMKASVRRHSEDVRVPSLDDPALLRIGAQCFHVNCVQCHGAPGISPEDMGKGLLPIPTSLMQAGRDWPPKEIYWVTRNGIRMAGMPAWGHQLSDRDIWGIVAFVHRQLPYLTVPQYQKLVESTAGESCSRPSGLMEPSKQRGLRALRAYGCDACHKIPGVIGPDVHVGPTLEGYAHRGTIAGMLPNTRENLIRWLRDPQSVSARTAMPDLAVTEQHAADMAAYLHSLE